MTGGLNSIFKTKNLPHPGAINFPSPTSNFTGLFDNDAPNSTHKFKMGDEEYNLSPESVKNLTSFVKQRSVGGAKIKIDGTGLDIDTDLAAALNPEANESIVVMLERIKKAIIGLS